MPRFHQNIEYVADYRGEAYQSRYGSGSDIEDRQNRADPSHKGGAHYIAKPEVISVKAEVYRNAERGREYEQGRKNRRVAPRTVSGAFS